MSNDYLERILKARVYDVATESPLEAAPRLSRRIGNTVLFKREDLQPVFSFKIRGAYNKIAHLSQTAAQRGVICASAGNHAQGVALAASRRGIPSTIVMPIITPQIKVQAVIGFGGNAVLHGDDFDQAYEHALHLAREGQLSFIHPFDDPDVIAGQGTIGVEILRQRSADQIDAIFVPVGGGGLISGIGAYVKQLFPKIRVIGVEPEDADAMYQSLQARKRITLDRVGNFADGVAVRRVGEEPFRLCQQYVDEVVVVTNDEICAAIQDIFEDNRAIVEPAGALAVAGIKKFVARDNCRDRSFVAINSGANMNFDRLRHVVERGDIGSMREATIAVEIPEQKGSFLKFCEALGRRSVTEFNYRYNENGAAHIFVGLGLTEGRKEKEAVLQVLRQSGYPVIDLSDNEMAKLHVRYMVGGHPGNLADERLFRFEFPERPGALLKFLHAIGTRWNISLFHYRNHGSDYGRVLAGVQVPPGESVDLDLHLRELKYVYTEETENEAYALFLGGKG
ncbi:threonine dehydratase [Povalibacter uvarum]|uniref:L-threonine dehydratase n=1 Tax=Povalibacter uvarum TaxID=732238 RepID=A0A841HT92_9GAMM|nr:threonine ammonia-lyase, biosynthetic [Povalibacter uvarum]MBB6096567.1 threonine dehydratase [Povalibacter uvarum]